METNKDKNKLTKSVNAVIRHCNKGDISDGYHTFKEMYDHRIELFIALCRQISFHNPDGLVYPDTPCFRTPVKDGWFIMGIFTEKGKQITYHLPETEYGRCSFAKEIKDYQFDGHKSPDVLQRIRENF